MHTATLEHGLCNLFIPIHFPSLTIPYLDDAEQIETDIASARETLADASAGVDKLHGELKSLVDKIAKVEVRTSPPVLATTGPHVSDRAHSHSQAEHGEAERRLQEERATLTRFDAELHDLEEVIKAKKQAAVDADVSIKKLEHEVQALAKEKAGHLTGAINLERQHDWIAEESQ